jgi:SAM-dependent methyltransferase
MPTADEDITRIAYDQIADIFADTFRATEPEQPIELAMIDHFISLLGEPRRVLDAGCGAGRMLPYLATRGSDPEGVDLSVEMIRRARQDHPTFPTRVGSLSHLDYPEDRFDGVFSWYSTIHNPDEDLDQMLGEMRRMLRPGGYLLLAFQTGENMRPIGRHLRSNGIDFDVVLNRYHRTVQAISIRLADAHFEVTARLERAAVGNEQDPQAVIIARKRVAQDTRRA